MTRRTLSAWVAIAVALIGAAATIGTAYIQRPRDAQLKESISQPVVAAAPLAAPARGEAQISVTGVQIGSTQGEPYVVAQRTVFSSNEEIAATVHYSAAEGIRNFPARLTVAFGNPVFGQLSEDQTADISTAGDSFLTFRFPAHQRDPGSYLFFVEIDGSHVYSKMIDIK